MCNLLCSLFWFLFLQEYTVIFIQEIVQQLKCDIARSYVSLSVCVMRHEDHLQAGTEEEIRKSIACPPPPSKSARIAHTKELTMALPYASDRVDQLESNLKIRTPLIIV